jgi:hypothetical protein
MALLVATAGQLQAGVININLAAAGTNSVNITGLNAGKTLDSDKTEVPGFAGTNELEIRFNSATIGLDPEGTMRIARDGGHASPHSFGAGATIDGSFGGTWSGSSDDTSFYSNGSSFSPDFGPNSFIGFRFSSGGGFNYGYIEVLWNWTGTTSTSSFQLLSAAYEDQENTAIVTPGGSVVPEPTSMAIFGLGALGMAYRARRKSKA